MKTFKSQYFINFRNNKILKPMLISLITILLLFLVTCIFVDNSNLKNNIVDNWKKTIQIFFTGFALGVSNYLLQRLTKNRLCDSSILGFGNINLIPIAILCLFTNFSVDPMAKKMSLNTFNIIMPIIVVLTSVFTCCLFMIASKEWYKINLKKILISGIILNFVAIAIAFSIISFANPRAKLEIEKYTIGYIGSNINKFNFYLCNTIIVLIFILLLIFHKKINLVLINQEIAKQVGENNFLIISLIMICSGLLIGSSYAMSGDFVFIGLISASIVMKLKLKNFATSLTCSGLIGAIMILGTYFIFFNLIDVPNYIIAPLIPIFISPYFLYTIIKS